MSDGDTNPSQRIDKWLWYTRIFKSRSLAAKFSEAGKIRIKNGEKRDRVTKSSHMIHCQDILTFTLHDRVRVVKVLSPGTRRGPAPEAQTLYEDLSPPRVPKDASTLSTNIARPRGLGRPTKKDRRALDQWHNQDQ